jgi:hypothetical protein
VSGLITNQLGQAGSSNMDLDAIPSSTTERVDPLDTLELVGRSAGNAEAELGTVDEYGRQLSAPEPSVDADALNAKWGIKGSDQSSSLTFNGPLPESVAQDMNAAKRDEIMRANAGQRSPGGVMSALTDLGFGMLDPVGIAASALPVFGEARIASLLGRAGIDFGEGVAGQVATRAVTGAVDATTANAPLVAARYGLSQQEQSDYSMTDAARDLAFGALLGGVLHPAIGAVTDSLHGFVSREPGPAALDNDPATRGAMMTAGVAAKMEDRPFDAVPFTDLAQARAEQEELWFRLSQDSQDLESEISGIRDTAPADPATSARLDAIQEELNGPAVTAERRAELAQEASLLTEGGQATPEGDDLYAARSQSQREGLQTALERNRQQIADIENSIYQSDMARRAGGEPSPEDAALTRQVDEATKAPPPKNASAPADINDQIAKLEADIQRTRSGGLEPQPLADGEAATASRLHPEDEASLNEVTTAEQASQARSRALLQAGACVARGLI